MRDSICRSLGQLLRFVFPVGADRTQYSEGVLPPSQWDLQLPTHFTKLKKKLQALTTFRETSAP